MHSFYQTLPRNNPKCNDYGYKSLYLYNDSKYIFRKFVVFYYSFGPLIPSKGPLIPSKLVKPVSKSERKTFIKSVENTVGITVRNIINIK